MVPHGSLAGIRAAESNPVTAGVAVEDFAKPNVGSEARPGDFFDQTIKG